jgi:hypothetical protein
MIVEIKKPNERIWESALAEAGPQGTIFQSTYWANYLKEAYGDKPIYIASLDKRGNINGLLMASESCYAKHPSLTMLGRRGLLFGRIYRHFASPVLHLLLPFVSWENGPLVLTNRINSQLEKKALYKEMVRRILDVAELRNCYEIKFARPPFWDDEEEAFSQFGFRKYSMGTFLVNLQQPYEELWVQAHKDARRTFRRGIEQGVEVARASKAEDITEFYNLHIQMANRENVKIFPFSYFNSLWHYFWPRGKMALFIARLKGETVSASIYLMHNGTIHLFATADSDYARTNRIFGSQVLIWNVIKWANEMGMRFFDLSGVELHKIKENEVKASTIYRFKSKWGGNLLEYHDYSKQLRKKRLTNLFNHVLADSVIHN